MSKTLLIVHHTPSPATREVLEAVLAGANDPEIDGVDVVVRPALGATVSGGSPGRMAAAEMVQGA